MRSSSAQLRWQSDARYAVEAQRHSLYAGTTCLHDAWAVGGGKRYDVQGDFTGRERGETLFGGKKAESDTGLDLLILSLVRHLPASYAHALAINRARYVALHPRTSYCGVDWQMDALGDSKQGLKFGRDHAAWSRVIAMRMLGWMAEWVLWVDADALLMSPGVPLTPLLKYASSQDKHLMFTVEPRRGTVTRGTSGETCLAMPPFVAVDGHLRAYDNATKAERASSLYGLLNGVFATRRSAFAHEWLDWMYLLPYGMPHAKLLWDQDAEWAWMMDDPAGASDASLFVSTSTAQVTPLAWRPGFPIAHGAAHAGRAGKEETKYDAIASIVAVCEAETVSAGGDAVTGYASRPCVLAMREWARDQCASTGIPECHLNFDLGECGDYRCNGMRCSGIPGYEALAPGAMAHAF